MAEFTFDFCPDTRVAEVIAPEEVDVRDFNGWPYSPRPVLPYQRRFKVTLGGLQWYLQYPGPALDVTTTPTLNAGRLEEFYTTHRTWKPFDFNHEYLGLLELRFDQPVSVPKALANAGGLIDNFEIMMIDNNPSYT